jgi:hypothetical protein
MRAKRNSKTDAHLGPYTSGINSLDWIWTSQSISSKASSIRASRSKKSIMKEGTDKMWQNERAHCSCKQPKRETLQFCQSTVSTSCKLSCTTRPRRSNSKLTPLDTCNWALETISVYKETPSDMRLLKVSFTRNGRSERRSERRSTPWSRNWKTFQRNRKNVLRNYASAYSRQRKISKL